MSGSDISPQESRENPDPGESSHPIPLWVLILSAGLLILCAVYIALSDSGAASIYGDQRTVSDLAPKASSGQATASGMDAGALFAARCAACHQAAGTGLAGVFPPLAGSSWVNGRDTTLIQIVLHGVQGPLTVNGASFNGVMPNFGTQLSDAEIAAVLTYVRGQWGNGGGPVSASQVAAQRTATASRSGAWNGDAELAKLP